MLAWLLNMGFGASAAEAPVVVEETPQNTGGWLSDPYRHSVRRERERLEIAEPLANLEAELAKAEQRRTARAKRAAVDKAYAEQLRLMVALEGMETASKRRRARAAMLMLVAAQ